VLTVDPPRSTVTVYRPDVAPRTFGHEDSIDVGGVVMGLVLGVADIFAA
jgi:hypothetical protein